MTASDRAPYELGERRIRQLLISSVLLLGVLIGIAVVAPSFFTLVYAAIGALGTAWLLRSWRVVRRILRARQ